MGNFDPKLKRKYIVDELINYLSKPRPVEIYFLRLIADFINIFRNTTVEVVQEKDAELAAQILKKLWMDINKFPLDDLANIFYTCIKKSGVN